MPHYFISAAGIVFVMAHEISKYKPWHNHDPLWEFLRHCRNAIAHGGSFHFSNGEPRRPAQWGPFVLTHALHGTPLFKKDGVCFHREIQFSFCGTLSRHTQP